MPVLTYTTCRCCCRLCVLLCGLRAVYNHAFQTIARHNKRLIAIGYAPHMYLCAVMH